MDFLIPKYIAFFWIQKHRRCEILVEKDKVHPGRRNQDIG